MAGLLASALLATPAIAADPSADPTVGESASPSADPSPTPADPSDSASPSSSPSQSPSESPSESPSASSSGSAAPSTSPSSPSSPSSSGLASADARDNAPQLTVPAPGTGEAVITVKVGGTRSGTSAVTPLAGVQLGFYANATGGAALFTCTSDADGDCSIVVPNTGTGGVNRNARYYIRQLSAPTGWYANPQLGAGNNSASSTDYTFRTGTTLTAGNTYRSGTDFMTDTGSVATASGGIWQNSRINADFPAKCGINVAMVLDVSGSVGSDLPNLKNAANTFVNALTGTPSAVAVYTFASAAPAAGNTNLSLTPISTSGGAATVIDRINASTIPNSSNYYTNWDRGIAQVAESGDDYDVAIVITDGNPTRYGQPAAGTGGWTRFREVENGIFSANRVKADGTKLIAFGVGSGVTSTASGLNLRSISGQTLNSDYFQTSDYSAAAAELKRLALGSCQGSVTVVKQVVPSSAPAGSTAGAQPAGGWTFTGSNPATGITITPPTGRVTAAGTGAVNFPLTFSGGTTGGAVTFTETQQTGYTLQQVSGQNATCTRTDTNVPVPAANQGALGFSVQASSTYPISCTVYNRENTAHLTLVKEVDNGNTGATHVPGDWTLSAAGPTQVSGAGNSPAVTDVAVQPGDYDLSESGPAGYDASDWDCDGGTQSGDSVTIGLGDDVTCTITNTAQQPHLTLVKTVTNDNGGTNVATDWTLTADGPTPDISGAVGDTAVTDAPVAVGDYDLSESGPAGYDAGDWDCDGGTQSGDSVSIGLGDDVTCTINNDDQPAQLTLVKEVVNDNGGTAVPTDWTLSADGPTTGITGATGEAAVTAVTVDAGDYDLSEAGGPTGYTAGDWDCGDADLSGETVTVPNGGDVTCTIINDDQPAQLTLIKEVDNGDTGSTHVPADWTLTAEPDGITGQGTVSGNGDPTTAGGVDQVEVFSGDYDLSESGPNGYESGTWVCEGGVVTPGDDAGTGTVTVPNGGNVICRITNTAVSPKLTLVKEVVNDNGGTAVATDWTLSANGPTPISGATGEAAVTSANVAVGDYDLSESGPDGYDASDWDCDGGTQSGATITLAEGDDVTCTIINDDQPALLTLVKVVVNDNGGTAVPTDWTLSADGPTTGITGPSGDDAVTAVTVDAGDYDLSEADGPDGYTASIWDCEGGTVTGGTTVTVPVGGDVTCTITNDDQPAQLTLVKEVVNDNGGTAVPTDWTLSADGPTAITGATGDDAVTNATVDAGDYDLSEADGPDGYTAGDWDCGDADLSGATVTVPNGGDVTCTIINDDQPAQLTLVKVVDNGDTGATHVPADWTLTADGPTPVTGAGNSADVTDQAVDAGDYDLSEDGPTGYDASDWVCTGTDDATATSVTIAVGDDVTCTITNTAQQPHLTLVKVVDNGDTGATHVPADWTLTADGPTPVTGAGNSADVTDQAVGVGDYDLSEDGPTGYDASDWVCTGADGSTTDSVTIALGDDATCTITNTAQQPHLTLVKEVVNDNGGTNVPTDWTLSADGPTSGISGPVGDTAVTDVPVAVGDYDLDEAAGAAVPIGGYTAGDWSCTSGLDGSTVSVGLGDDVTCTIVNDDSPAQLTLVKEVDGDAAGSDHVPADWTLTADGPTAVSGNGDPSTSGGVDHVTVDAGDYDLSEDGPSGFDAGDWVCEGGVVAPGDDAGTGTVTVPSGGNVVCTITNTAIAPKLTLIKEVDNTHGGDATPADWGLSADGPTPISGITGDEAITAADVHVGTYTLAETAGPEGYTASEWSCEGAEVTDGDQITLAEGDDATCTIVNTSQAGTWTVTKSSDPVSGSTVEPGDVITYTVTASKLTGADQENVVVNDDLSKVLNHATLVPGSIDASTGTASVSGTTLTWNIPVLSGNQTVTYQVKVDADAYGVQLKNVVTSPGSEPCVPADAGRAAEDEECNSTHHYTPKWTLTKSSDPKSGSKVKTGSVIAYRLHVENTSQAVVRDAVVTDDLSDVLDHASLIRVPRGATLRGTTLTWKVPTLQPGDTADLRYRVRIDKDAYALTIGNVATPSAGGTCVNACSTEHKTPPKNENENTPPPGNPGNPGNPWLPNTGGPALWLAGLAALLLASGLWLVLLARRRHG